jgi:transcriptional regulator with XRE-family HTH domain
MYELKPMRALTQVRRERGLSQQGLADASGVNKATINQIERGRRSPNVETLEKLAEALSVEVADFFPKVEPRLPFEVDEAFFVEPEEGEEPETVTLKLQIWHYLENDDALLQKVARVVEEHQKTRAETG